MAGGFGEFKVLAGRTGGPTSGWFDQFDLACLSPECDRPVQGFPIRYFEVQHEAAESLPEVERTSGLFAGPSEQPAASLLDLIDEECEHHEAGEDGRQVVASMAEIVFEVVALVLEPGFMMPPFSTLSTGHGH